MEIWKVIVNYLNESLLTQEMVEFHHSSSEYKNVPAQTRMNQGCPVRHYLKFFQVEKKWLNLHQIQ